MSQETETELDWNSLVLKTHPSRGEIAEAVYTFGNLDGWQICREGLRGLTMLERWRSLHDWLLTKKYSQTAKIQVSNYVLALKRGGMWR